MRSETTPLFVYGLKDLIKGMLPSFIGWDVDPDDAADITDDDPESVCTGGSATIVAWDCAYMEYDLGGFYEVAISGIGSCIATVGTSYLDILFYDGTNWIGARSSAASGAGTVAWTTYIGRTSKIRIRFQSSANSDISPKVNEMHAWRLR